MAQAAEQARAELSAARDEPGGELRIAAAVGFARHIAPALGAWLASHPALRLHLAVDDALIDLIHGRIDLALRFGQLADSGWAARRLGAMQWWLCAAPAWVQAQGLPPRHPAPLAGERWLGLARDSHAQPAVQIEARQPASGETCNLQLQPRMDVADALAAGRLVRLLPDWDFGSFGIWAVTPQRQAQPAKVRQAVAALQRYLAQLPGVVDAPPAAA